MIPEQIFIYRDGLGGPTLMEKAYSQEVPTVVECFGRIRVNYSPEIVYCFVEQNSIVRFFNTMNGDIMNPGPGTVVDAALVEN